MSHVVKRQKKAAQDDAEKIFELDFHSRLSAKSVRNVKSLDKQDALRKCCESNDDIAIKNCILPYERAIAAILSCHTHDTIDIFESKYSAQCTYRHRHILTFFPLLHT